ncbi:MAG: MoxR family ATPase [Deltaproteobacteria bacterium]|uniref:MoxR family ATPase n=1 Tax=Candidatus Zymogenus saltonus TaxID=2844893 RepID=A0A9D8PLV6_9DELT|nr:MoxR family ATPase [Candidatus Zymogenus saltonus]
MLNTVAKIKSTLDEYVVGHDDVKEGILLALIAREHVYIEGAPGTAKTMLAELAAKAANLQFYFYQFHRDTRLSELIGEYIISREETTQKLESGNGKGELIRQQLLPGGILTAQMVVLDDITRAPGEALNILLRLLNEREYQGIKLPLLTAIATSNPTQDDYYNEPLDLANLDRFAIQLRSQGLLTRGNWDEALSVLDYYVDHIFDKDSIKGFEAELFEKPIDYLLDVEVPQKVRKRLMKFLSKLIDDYHLNETNSLLTDRTFLVKAVRILKAKAILEGRKEVSPGDLSVLKYMTTFRVPEEIAERIEEILENLDEKKK